MIIDKMETLEVCTKNKEFSKLLKLLAFHTTIEGKIEILKHLKKNPVYKCYFCDGLNKSCKEFQSYVDRIENGYNFLIKNHMIYKTKGRKKWN